MIKKLSWLLALLLALPLALAYETNCNNNTILYCMHFNGDFDEERSGTTLSCKAGYCGYNYTNGVISQGLRINSTIIPLPIDVIKQPNITISMWFQVNGDSDNVRLGLVDDIYGNNGNEFRTWFRTDSRELTTQMADPEAYSSVISLANNEWHQLDIVYSNGTTKNLTYYIDGIKNYTTTFTYLANLHLIQPAIGSAAPSGYLLNGTIDEFLVYNFSFNDAQAKALYDLHVNNSAAIDNCSLYSNVVLDIKFYNETTLDKVNASYQLALEYTTGGASTNLTFSGQYFNATICSGESGYLDGIIKYYTNSEYPRYYYFENISFLSTNHINLYLITDVSLIDPVGMYVYDETDSVLGNAYIKTQRQYLNDNTYKLVTMSKTSYNGYTQQYLQKGTANYIFTVEKDGRVLSPTPTQSSPIYLDILYFKVFTLSDYLDNLRHYGNIGYTLNYNNATNAFTFSYSDTKGLSDTGCMKVTHTTILRQVIDYDNCVATGAGTITYTASDNNTYVATAYIKTDSGTIMQPLGVIQSKGAKAYQRFGLDGALMGVVFSISLAAVGTISGSMAVPILLYMIGIGSMYLLDFVHITLPTLMGLIVLAGLVIWKLRS